VYETFVDSKEFFNDAGIPSAMIAELCGVIFPVDGVNEAEIAVGREQDCSAISR